MASLMFLPVADKIESGTYLLYDCACGTGGMLTVAEETLQQIATAHGKQVATHLYTEDPLVEQPAIGLFAELGWTEAGPPPNACAAGEPRDAGFGRREAKGELVLFLSEREIAELRIHARPALDSRQPAERESGLGVSRGCQSHVEANRVHW